MRIRRALRKPWVRACLLIPTAVIVFAVCFVLCQVLVEWNHDSLGEAAGCVAWGSMMVAIFFGPAWVVRGKPAPPTPDGPPRGLVVPFPMRTPGDARPSDVVRSRPDQAARTFARGTRTPRQRPLSAQ